MTLDLRSLSPTELAPSSRPKALKPGSHFVQLYDDDPALLGALRAFLGNGLRIGDAVICLATPEHLEQIGAALIDDGIDLDEARRTDAFIGVDAAEARNAVSYEGAPNPALFSAFLGDLILKAAADGRHVRIFGEIVALLWAEGARENALRLEELWNDLAEIYPFQLFCAYPVHAFSGEDAGSVSEMCSKHTHVLPPS